MKGKKISGVLLYLLGCVLLLLLYMNFVYTPLSGAVSSLEQKHNETMEQINTLMLQQEKKGELVKNIDDLKAKIAKAEAENSVTAQNAEEDIGTACINAGIEPKSLTLGEETAESGKKSTSGKTLYSVTADLQITCTDAQLQTVLNYLEKESKGAYYVKSISYKKDKDSLEVSLSVLLYYFGAPEVKK